MLSVLSILSVISVLSVLSELSRDGGQSGVSRRRCIGFIAKSVNVLAKSSLERATGKGASFL